MTGHDDSIAVRPRWLSAIVFWTALAVADCGLYLSAHFFQGDSLFWLHNRFQDFSAFLRSVVTVDPLNWYRPLSSRPIPSVMFPLFGLAPLAYHIVTLALFFTAGIAVFVFLRRILRDDRAAGIAVVFFSIHSVGAFVTYDIAFLPELLYTLFYVLAAASFAVYLRIRSTPWYAASTGLFVLALASKESAVTLPVVLAAFGFLLSVPGPGTGMVRHLWKAATGPWAHWLVLGAYMAFVVGFLGVGGYGTSIGSNLLDADALLNYGTGWLWALNVPVGWQAQSRDVPGSIVVLVSVAAAMITLALCARVYRRDKVVLFGLVWFTVTIGPALPLYDHFLPYYLFLPLVGVALCLGQLFQTREQHRWQYRILQLTLPVAIVTAIVSIRNDRRLHPILGVSSLRAEQSVMVVKNRHPTLQPGTIVYINNDEQPDLWWDHGLGNLYKLVYSDSSVETRFSSIGDTITPEILRTGRAIILKASGGEIIDVTEEALANPELIESTTNAVPVEYEGRSDALSIVPSEVEAGKGFYTLRIAGYAKKTVNLRYSIDSGPETAFTVRLDANETIRFFVPDFTRKGRYRFTAFKSEEARGWLQTDATILIY